jgi:hypothetical protein
MQKQFSYLLLAWICVILIGVVIYSVSDTGLVQWGPNKSLFFLDIIIDTWQKWIALILFIMITQTLKVLADEIISPFIMNTIMDHKEKELHFSYSESQFICQSYYIFSGIAKVIHVSIAMSQVDCILVVLLTDVVISTYTTHIFLKNKISQEPDDCEISEDLEEFILSH